MCLCVFVFEFRFCFSLVLFRLVFLFVCVCLFFLISNKLDLINFHKADGRLMQKANALASLVICLLSLLDMAA